MAQQNDLDAWIRQAGALQENILQARVRLQEAEVTGTAGAGAVAVRLSAAGELRDIRIDPAATDDVAALQRHIVAAHAQALADARALSNDMMAALNELMGRLGPTTLAT
jgi:DNA-binding YbaB/EbfC family protein